VPDLQHEYYPEFFSASILRERRRGFTPALSAAGAIGTISEYVRQTLREQEFTACRDIFLMSPAWDDDNEGASTPEATALLPGDDYFFYPANLWPHKNHHRVLHAFQRFLQRSGRTMRFILTGHPDGWDRLRGSFPRLPIQHLGYVRAPMLRRLMQQARALVFFSLYEGFGMPLLEAFAAGTPVICSNTTSLPEVGGDAVLSCDPTDVDAMSELMARVADDQPLRADLTARGRQRLQGHSWQQSAHNLFQAFQRVARKQTADVERLHEVSPPLVSIVTPSYNQGRFLRKTIDSVLGQTYPHLEYIVIDGASSDESVAVLKSYGTRLAWISEPDRGQTYAINKGFARLHGSIRAYLNSDDLLLPDAVATAVRHFARHPEWDMIYGRAHYIDAEDRRIGDYNTADFDFERLMEDCCVCQPAAFWRTRIASRVGPFDERLDYVMDYDYWIRIDRAGGLIAHVPDFLACSRLHADAKTVAARYAIYQELFRACLERAGYVCESHFHGFWHHLCQERQAGWPRRLRWLPGFQQKMAYWHHKWYRNGGSVTALCRDASRALARRLRLASSKCSAYDSKSAD
jgi:glycosyltransferase involved in cell wall biosynthesis